MNTVLFKEFDSWESSLNLVMKGTLKPFSETVDACKPCFAYTKVGYTECVNSTVSRFGKKFLGKLFLRGCTATVVWPTGLVNFHINF